MKTKPVAIALELREMAIAASVFESMKPALETVRQMAVDLEQREFPKRHEFDSFGMVCCAVCESITSARCDVTKSIGKCPKKLIAANPGI